MEVLLVYVALLDHALVRAAKAANLINASSIRVAYSPSLKQSRFLYSPGYLLYRLIDSIYLKGHISLGYSYLAYFQILLM